ncbi:formylglycine-generating enzyme family protein [Sphingomonas sp. KC8]|uniref:formylglycine-generating enzyme family protein n=1 Tax=Sphingomonas sp. KC8 TaxID=1030157 RepID=UPI0002F59250|nr:formylglycine-generating enzyme family protein [Sphingomonas sp. KC8]ARS27556.1 gliding motility-associated lipoprotein GldK [Sphingomonas sp. KC8]
MKQEGKTVDGMIAIKGGRFRMGSDRHYPEEAPAHDVIVDDFAIDATPVTNAQFAAFVAATGHVTFAETPPNPDDYPGILPEMIRAGSLVFTPPPGPIELRDPFAWWSFTFDADWRRPYGPGSTIDGLDDHPVVHIAYADAQAYADWAGKSLPTEAEWEFAARGGIADADYAWGDELEPGGVHHANVWQGAFPWQNLGGDGWERTSPVRNYPANGYGLFDMIGNVWEWTADWYADRHAAKDPAASACCVPRNPRGAVETESRDPCMPDLVVGRRVLKGGSHLCAPNYCQRYRPAARYAQPIDTSTSHVGFRCVVR